jgi:hypothetical protein
VRRVCGGGVSKVDREGKHTLEIKALGDTIATCEPQPACRTEWRSAAVLLPRRSACRLDNREKGV